MVCSRCKKRPAVVFIARQEDGKTVNDGYCLTCAKELNIGPVNDMLEKFGISEEDLEQMDEQLGEMMGEMQDMMGDGEGNSFDPGGAATFPFFRNLFSGNADAGGDTNPSFSASAHTSSETSANANAQIVFLCIQSSDFCVANEMPKFTAFLRAYPPF